MPQYNSQWSAFSGERTDLADERVSDKIVAPTPFWSAFQGDSNQQTGNGRTDVALWGGTSTNTISQPTTTGMLGSRSVTPVTQSLVTALQATMEDELPVRPMLVIPGSGLSRRARKAEQMRERKLFFPRWQLSFLMVAVTFFIALSLFSISPVGRNYAGASPFSRIVLLGGQSASDTATIDGQRQAQQAAQTTTQQSPMELSTSEYVQVARNAAVKCGIPPDAFVRQIQTESGFNPYAVSPSGAVGIAQFMPATAAGLGIDPWDPVQALNGAACFMASLAADYNGNYAMALAAYNAGSGNLNYALKNCGDAWLSCMPAETQNYVARIMG